MITRICISINNRCNLKCSYCHFHEKTTSITETNMDVYKILDNIKDHIDKYNIECFKIGFVGNGEPLLDFNILSNYILYIDDYIKMGKISAYTITNGTLADKEKLVFFKEHNINVGFSIDGLSSIHNKLRCNSYYEVISAIEQYYILNGHYPSMNCTVGKEVINNAEETINFFKKFNNRITFSRMIGKNSIHLETFNEFMQKASTVLNVRTGGYDCTMYGGMCGAGINNLYFANGYVFICGNCIDIPSPFSYDTPIDQIKFEVFEFDRKKCYKEVITK